MQKVSKVRPILLSAPYGTPENLEVQQHLKSGYRTTGLVEVTLEDGTTGLGEAYMAVFAPRVFTEIVELVAPYMVGKESFDLRERYREACTVTDYWSRQGAARHVVGAFEMALLDANAKMLGIPAHVLLGGMSVPSIGLYGSGGDSATPETMWDEIEHLGKRGIEMFKIRARNHEVGKTAWVLDHAGERGIEVAVDMAQNLAYPAQSVTDVTRFLTEVRERSPRPVLFLEEALGPFDAGNLPLLRARLECKVAGGETVTTAHELCELVRHGCYDLAQPDATVIGGVHQVLEVFAACRQNGCEAVVHSWGSAVGMMANYHAAFVGGGRLAEWPMPTYPLREELMVEPLRIEEGRLLPSATPGLGVCLTSEQEEAYPFREDAVYSCMVNAAAFDLGSAWQHEPE